MASFWRVVSEAVAPPVTAACMRSSSFRRMESMCMAMGESVPCKCLDRSSPSEAISRLSLGHESALTSSSRSLLSPDSLILTRFSSAAVEAAS